MKLKNFLLFGLIFLFIASCGKKEEENTIGIILPLTGNLAFMGQPEKNGFLLAYEDFEKENPKLAENIKIIFEDTQSNPQSAVSAALKLINDDKSKILIIANTGPNLAISPITQRENVLQIAFCTEPDIQNQHDNIFRLYQSAIQEGKAILEYLNKATEKESKRISFLYIDQANFVKTVDDIIVPGLKNDKNKIFKERYQLTEISFRSTLTRIKKNNIDILVILGYGNEYKVIFDQMTELGIRNKLDIIGGWGFLYPQVSAEKLQGVKVVGPIFSFSEKELSRQFKNEFRKNYSEEPNFDAAYAYTALQILLTAISKANLNNINSISYQIEDNDFETPIGNVKIKDREMIVEMGVAEFSNGNLILK